GGAHRGEPTAPDHLPPPPPQLLPARHRPGHAGHGLRDPHGGGALVYRPRHPAADERVGGDDRGGRGVHRLRRVVDLRLSRHGHHGHGPLVQPGGRCLARRPGPADEGRVTDLLALEDLTVHFETDEGVVQAVDGAALTIGPGEVVGLVGESGSGKSVTALAILRLLRPPARVASGRAHFAGRDLLALSEEEMRSVRGSQISMADAPTTGVDVSIAAQILELLRDLGRRTGAAILLITHDLGVVARLCDRVVVMHAGQTVEWATVRGLFHAPAHPYTRALIHAIPRVDREVAMEPIPGSVP